MADGRRLIDRAAPRRRRTARRQRATVESFRAGVDADGSGCVSLDEFEAAFEFVPAANLRDIAARWNSLGDLPETCGGDLGACAAPVPGLAAWQTVRAPGRLPTQGRRGGLYSRYRVRPGQACGLWLVTRTGPRRRPRRRRVADRDGAARALARHGSDGRHGRHVELVSRRRRA
mmetsp:Transcript_25940/g.78176  ORF Transcript_25940/g.78176 Transcript_25940/m.78176 type:complete len:174 (+) Transcript_25940:694-1215(+)